MLIYSVFLPCSLNLASASVKNRGNGHPALLAFSAIEISSVAQNHVAIIEAKSNPTG